MYILINRWMILSWLNIAVMLRGALTRNHAGELFVTSNVLSKYCAKHFLANFIKSTPFHIPVHTVNLIL